MAVAILSTGDELINGDIQNTTSIEIAHHLFSHQVPMGMQMSVNDVHEDMLSGMQFLLSCHNTLIVTGGLGPTSDDRTRYAMAEYFDESLVLHDSCWQHILEKHKVLGIEMNPSNKQQALFPKEASLFHNAHGTAYGCAFSKNNKTMILLPGPPSECMPMFYEYAAPLLLVHREETTALYRWLLFGVPEAEIAAAVEKRLEGVQCELSYRWHYPYIEVKIKARDLNKAYFDSKLMTLFKPLIISPPDKTALSLLKETLLKMTSSLVIEDEVTKGRLQSELVRPGLNHLSFKPVEDNDTTAIRLTGLSTYWLQGKEKDTVLLEFFYARRYKKEMFTVSLKKSNVLSYVLELMAYHINNWLASC